MTEAHSDFTPWRPFCWLSEDGRIYPLRALPPWQEKVVWTTTTIICRCLMAASSK